MAGSSWTNQVVSQVIIAGKAGQLLVYSGPPALGNLVYSVSALATVDPFGNVVFEGATSYQANGTITPTTAVQTDNGAISIGIGAAFAGTGGAVPSLITTGGTGQLDILSGAASGTDTQSGFTLQSATVDGTAPLNLANGYIGLNPLVANPSKRFPSVYADISTLTPSAGLTSGFQGAIAVGGPADFTPHTVTQATLTQLSKVFAVPANDAQTGTVYRLTAAGTAVWGSTQQALTFALSAFGVANFASLPIGATEFTASLALQWRLVAEVAVQAGGNPGTILGGMSAGVAVSGANELTQVNTNQSAGGFASFNAANATANTQVNANVTLQAKWAATTGAPTITCGYSYLERLGA